MRALSRWCRALAWLAPAVWVAAVPVVIALAMRHPGGHPSGDVVALDASVQLAEWLGGIGLAAALLGLVAARSTPGVRARALAMAAGINALLVGAALALAWL
jgi:hypothetical protein